MVLALCGNFRETFPTFDHEASASGLSTGTGTVNGTNLLCCSFILVGLPETTWLLHLGENLSCASDYYSLEILDFSFD